MATDDRARRAPYAGQDIFQRVAKKLLARLRMAIHIAGERLDAEFRRSRHFPGNGTIGGSSRGMGQSKHGLSLAHPEPGPASRRCRPIRALAAVRRNALGSRTALVTRVTCLVCADAVDDVGGLRAVRTCYETRGRVFLGTRPSPMCPAGHMPGGGASSARNPTGRRSSGNCARKGKSRTHSRCGAVRGSFSNAATSRREPHVAF